jgi:hypothetical protein
MLTPSDASALARHIENEYRLAEEIRWVTAAA